MAKTVASSGPSPHPFHPHHLHLRRCSVTASEGISRAQTVNSTWVSAFSGIPLLPIILSSTSNMDAKLLLLFLLVLSATGTLDAREMPRNLEALQPHEEENESPRNTRFCTLCVEYTEIALKYLTENKTQTEIIELLHLSCSQLQPFKQECITLVDYYVPMFFLEISSIQPEEFCEKVGLCKEVAAVSLRVQEDRCEFCQDAVTEVLDKLKDPDTQMEIIQLLLKACNSMDSYVKKCKKMVFEYGPLILTNMEQFLETVDVCTALHACSSSNLEVKVEESSATRIKDVPLRSDSGRRYAIAL